MIYLTVALVFLLRLAFLKVSVKNEKRILAEGGKEYGQANSKKLTILHILFYICAPLEALWRGVHYDMISYVGLGLILFSMLMLFVVVSLLKEIWTVKLMILNKHYYVDHFPFRWVKHPNYFLNILPELLGLSLLCHALVTALILSPFYLYVIVKRIQEEERLLKEIIIPNGTKAKILSVPVNE